MTWALINLVDFFVLANFKCAIKQRRLLCRSLCLVGKNNKVSCATAESKSLSSSFGSEAFQHFLWAWLVEAIMPAQRSWSKFCPCCRRSLLSLHSTPWLLNNRLQKKKIFWQKWFCCHLGLPLPGSVLLWKWCGRDLRLRTLTDLLKPWLPAASFVFRSLCKLALVLNSVLLWSELCRLFFEAVQDLCQLGRKSEEVSRGFLDCHKFLILFFFFLFHALLLRRNLIFQAKQHLQPKRVELQLLLLPPTLYLLLLQCSPCMHLCLVPLTAAVRASASEPVLFWKCLLKRKAMFTYRPK